MVFRFRILEAAPKAEGHSVRKSGWRRVMALKVHVTPSEPTHPRYRQSYE
jgi:hypothetical protein